MVIPVDGIDSGRPVITLMSSQSGGNSNRVRRNNGEDLTQRPIVMESFFVQNSSTVARVQFHEDTQTLEVEFLSGGVYQYFDVPQPLYEQLIAADSVGTFLNTNIKGAFRYARV